MEADELARCISHLRDRTYMSGIERDQLRVKRNGEVFTPTALVKEMLDHMPQDKLFDDLAATFCDPSCGDGQFLSEVIIRKLEHGSTLEQAVGTTFGVELMRDNVELCRERLSCGKGDTLLEYPTDNCKTLHDLVTRNIVCHDFLTYDCSFNGTDLNDDELAMKQKYNLAW